MILPIEYNVTKAFYFRYMLIFDLSMHQRILKKMYSTVLNIHKINNNNNTCFLSSKSKLLLKDRVTGVMMLKNSSLITEINYSLKSDQIESSYFCCILYQINAGLVSRSNDW